MTYSSTNNFSIRFNSWLKFSFFLSMLMTILVASHNSIYLVADDALFYPQIAEVFLATGKVSFNGYDITNGFHPLQFGLVTLIHKCFAGAARQTLLSIDVLIGGVFAVGAVFMMRQILKRERNAELNVVFSCALFALYICGGTYVSEAQINAFMLLSSVNIVIALLSGSGENRRINFYAGIILGLTILARLDNAVPVGLISIYLLRKQGLMWTLFFGVFVVIFPYFAANFLVFGSLMPISGEIKSTFPHINNFLDEPRISLTLTLMFLEFVALYLVKSQKGEVANISKILLISSIILNFYYVLFQEASTHSWYHVIGMSGLSLASANIVKNASKKFMRFPVFLSSSSIILILLLPVYVVRKINTGGYGLGVFMERNVTSDLPNNRGLELKSMTASNAKILAYDNPGELAYFSERSVTALDGLTLNRIAIDQMRHKLSTFLQERGITFIAMPMTSACREDLSVFEYYNGSPLGMLKIKCASARDLKRDKYVLVEINYN